jgi:hypothetical protein
MTRKRKKGKEFIREYMQKLIKLNKKGTKLSKDTNKTENSKESHSWKNRFFIWIA